MKVKVKMKKEEDSWWTFTRKFIQRYGVKFHPFINLKVLHFSSSFNASCHVCCMTVRHPPFPYVLEIYIIKKLG